MTSAELLSWYIKMHDELLFIMSKRFEMKGDSLMLSGLCFSVSLWKCFQKYFLTRSVTHWCILLQVVLLNKLPLSKDCEYY